jgi:MYXO-CTERM domain-containing protein
MKAAFSWAGSVIVALWCLNVAAFESEPAPVLLEHESPVLETFQHDTGWVPASGSIQVRFVITAQGHVKVRMEGESHVTWPEAYSFSLAGDVDGGMLTAGYSLDLEAKVKINLMGYQGEFEVPYNPPSQLAFEGNEVFDPFLLPGNPDRPVALTVPGEKLDVISAGFTVLSVVTINFHAAVKGAMDCTFQGDEVDLGNNLSLADESQVAVVDWAQDGTLTVSLGYKGTATCTLSIVIVPWVEVCIPVVGCTQLASFDLPVQAQTDTRKLELAPVEVAHHFAILSLDETKAVDFGKVVVMSAGTVDFPVGNDGLVLLEASFEAGPEGEFGVFPLDLWGGPSGQSGVVLYFTPEDVATYQGKLTINTNDPDRPLVEIPLLGDGSETEVNPVPSDGAAVGPEAAATEGAELWDYELVPLPGDASDLASASDRDGTESGDDYYVAGSRPQGCGCRTGPEAADSADSSSWAGAALLLLLFGLAAGRRRGKAERAKHQA